VHVSVCYLFGEVASDACPFVGLPAFACPFVGLPSSLDVCVFVGMSDYLYACFPVCLYLFTSCKEHIYVLLPVFMFVHLNVYTFIHTCGKRRQAVANVDKQGDIVSTSL